MPVRVTDYVDVAARAEELGCRAPAGIALLPNNFATAGTAAELCFHEAVPAIRDAWRGIGLIDPGRDGKRLQPQVFDGAAASRPVQLTVFLGAGVLRDGPGMVTLALGIVAAVLSARVSPREDLKHIRFDAIVERSAGSGYACLAYSGDVYELVALGRVVREVWANGHGAGDE